jgi:hypothetical protein
VTFNFVREKVPQRSARPDGHLLRPAYPLVKGAIEVSSMRMIWICSVLSLCHRGCGLNRRVGVGVAGTPTLRDG